MKRTYFSSIKIEINDSDEEEDVKTTHSVLDHNIPWISSSPIPDSPDAQVYLDFLQQLDHEEDKKSQKKQVVLISSESSSSTESESDSFIDDPPTPVEDPTYSEASVREETHATDSSSDSDDPDDVFMDPTTLRDLRAYQDHLRRYFKYGQTLGEHLDKLLHFERTMHDEDLNVERRYMPNI